MILTQDQFIKHIQDQNFCWGRVFTPTRELFALWETDTPEEFIDRVNVHANMYPGKWYFVCKKKANYPESTTCKFDILLGDPVDAKNQQQNYSIQGTPVDEEKIYQRVKKELQTEWEAREKDKKIAELEKKLEGNNSNGEKFVALVDLFLQKWKNPPSPTPKLAGTESKPQATEEEKAMWKEGLEIFVQHTDAKTFLGIAQKVNENPNLINQVKTFLNV